MSFLEIHNCVWYLWTCPWRQSYKCGNGKYVNIENCLFRFWLLTLSLITSKILPVGKNILFSIFATRISPLTWNSKSVLFLMALSFVLYATWLSCFFFAYFFFFFFGSKLLFLTLSFVKDFNCSLNWRNPCKETKILYEKKYFYLSQGVIQKIIIGAVGPQWESKRSKHTRVSAPKCSWGV